MHGEDLSVDRYLDNGSIDLSSVDPQGPPALAVDGQNK